MSHKIDVTVRDVGAKQLTVEVRRPKGFPLSRRALADLAVGAFCRDARLTYDEERKQWWPIGSHGSRTAPSGPEAVTVILSRIEESDLLFRKLPDGSYAVDLDRMTDR